MVSSTPQRNRASEREAKGFMERSGASEGRQGARRAHREKSPENFGSGTRQVASRANPDIHFFAYAAYGIWNAESAAHLAAIRLLSPVVRCLEWGHFADE
jgi:hypothetical protein